MIYGCKCLEKYNIVFIVIIIFIIIIIIIIKFINISISSFGVLDKECSTLFRMLDTLGLDQKDPEYCTRKMMSIAKRSTYYIF